MSVFHNNMCAIILISHDVLLCVCHIVLCSYPLRFIQPLVNVSVNDMLKSLLEKDLLVQIVKIKHISY